MPHQQRAALVLMTMMTTKMEKQQIWKVGLACISLVNKQVVLMAPQLTFSVFLEYEESGLLETDEVDRAKGRSMFSLVCDLLL